MSLLLFKKEFAGAIRSGAKTTTLRRWLRPRVHAGKRAFAPGIGWLIVEAIEPIDLKSLTKKDASNDGFASKAIMVRTLLTLYPNSDSDGKTWYRIQFRVDKLLGA